MSVKDAIKNILPRPLYLKVRRGLLYGVRDIFDTATGRRLDLVPPRTKIFIGGNEFVKVGDEFFEHFRSLGGVKADHRILDIGCGIGRMARPFVSFLSPKGEYEGFDIDKEGVEWCEKNISTRYPAFHFKWVDIYNKNYNVKGKVQANQFRFPYPDSHFDFIFATSVYTHMFPGDVENYLKESARVLKPGGTCLFTFFLRNEESEKLIRQKKSKIDFQYEMDGILTSDKHVPEDAICLQEEFVKGIYSRNGLTIDSPIRYGSWSGREKHLSFQDIIIAKK